jgi:hypothetical protein
MGWKNRLKIIDHVTRRIRASTSSGAIRPGFARMKLKIGVMIFGRVGSDIDGVGEP